jgi:hypothetical protein
LGRALQLFSILFLWLAVVLDLEARLATRSAELAASMQQVKESETREEEAFKVIGSFPSCHSYLR